MVIVTNDGLCVLCHRHASYTVVVHVFELSAVKSSENVL